jgi:phosphoglycolate phosphatase-like HAD superfamily hydrolase
MIGDRRSDIQAAKNNHLGQLAVNSGLRIIDILAIVQTLW